MTRSASSSGGICAQEPGGHGMGRENGDLPPLHQAFQPGNMIGVLMGNEHSADLFQFKVQRFQGSGNPAPGYSRIDQELVSRSSSSRQFPPEPLAST